ncbi:MAG: hypothetical protein K2X39_05190, partial [Silvanigrellaceae bacterium]|nr:hypothetical protein [Silvanigrellaceae bacterium]
FEVQTPFGLRYTRDGAFNVSPEGCLVTKNGAIIAGESGPITDLGKGELRILPSGEVYCNDKFIDKIKVVSFNQKSNLERLGENLWVYNGKSNEILSSQANIAQGYLEGSNVNPMRNLTNMIAAHRNYEALQKTVKAHDETMQNANKISEFQ